MTNYTYKNSKKLFITDFDGTLARSDGTFSSCDIKALEELPKYGVIRIIASGRSLFSLYKVIGDDFPVDYLISSTGAGISSYPKEKILKKSSLKEQDVDKIIDVLTQIKLDFMVHKPIKDNHIFKYRYESGNNPDFVHRLNIYKDYCQPLNNNLKGFGKATQVLVVAQPEKSKHILDIVCKKLPEFNIIPTTSPLDGTSSWIEIFPNDVSKSMAAAWFAKKINISQQNTISIGNDYNDLDLLEWSGTAFVVDNAPARLKSKFISVPSNNRCGVAKAVKKWLATEFGG